MVSHCSGCKAFTLQPIGKQIQKGKTIKCTPAVGATANKDCANCGFCTHIGGPFYSDIIHNREFIARMLDHILKTGHKYGTKDRMLGMLTLQSEELDTPFFYSLPVMMSVLHCQAPPISKFVSAILNAGYKVSESHTAQSAIKTDAPMEVVYDVVRGWCKLNPPLEKRIKENSAAKRILSVEPKITANFELHPDAVAPSRKHRFVRFQINPTANWGPMTRPKKARIE